LAFGWFGRCGVEGAREDGRRGGGGGGRGRGREDEKR